MIGAIGINSELYDYGSGYSSIQAQNDDEQSLFLKEKLEAIKDEQGLLGKAWNGIKEVTNLGVSASDCNSMLRRYNNGEISFEEAVNYLDEFNSKQEAMSGLLSNILTGAGAIAFTTLTAGTGSIAWSLALAKGAPVGAALKTGINLIDRATNDVEGDAFDCKEIAKDAISGAITGATSAVSSSETLSFKLFGNKMNDGFAKSALKGALCGVECGALAGSTSYLTDVAFGDKEFSASDMLANTASSMLVSGTVGGAIGAGIQGVSNLGSANAQGAIRQTTQGVAKESAKATSGTGIGQVIHDAFLSSTRKVLGYEVKDTLNI